jgi:uncharacterized protein YraI
VAQSDIELPGILAAEAAVNACIIASINDANLRSGPGTNYAITGMLSAGQAVNPVGYNRGDGYRWWQISGDEWIRADLVNSSGDCHGVSYTIAPTPPPDPIVIGNQTCGWETVHTGDAVWFFTGTHKWDTSEAAEAAFQGLMPTMTLDGQPLTNIVLDGVTREQARWARQQKNRPGVGRFRSTSICDPATGRSHPARGPASR